MKTKQKGINRENGKEKETREGELEKLIKIKSVDTVVLGNLNF